jgi:hypothetical protein
LICSQFEIYVFFLFRLGGILAGYGNLVIEHPKADLLFDQSNIHVDVVGDFYIFNPEVNKELTGKLLLKHCIVSEMPHNSPLQL